MPRGPFVRLVRPGRHTSAVQAIAAAPGRVYTAGQDKAILEWDAATGKLLRTFRVPIGRGHGGCILALAVTADGKRLAFAGLHPLFDEGAGGMVGTLDLASGLPTAVAGAHPGGVDSVAFGPDGRRLLSVGAEGAVRGWTVGDSGELKASGIVHEGTCAAWLDSTRFAVGAGEEAILYAWKGDATIRAGATRVKDAEVLAAARGEGAVWFATTSGVWSWGGEGDPVRVSDIPAGTIAVAPDGSRAVTWERESLFVHVAGRRAIEGRLEGAIPCACAFVAPNRIWVGDGGGRIARLLVGADAMTITDRDIPRAILAVGARPGAIAWGTGPDLVRAFDLRRLQPSEDLAGFTRAVTRGDPSAELEDGGALKIRSGRTSGSWTPPLHEEEITCWTFLDGSRLAVGTTHAIHVVRADTCATERTCIGHEGDIMALAPMDGGKRLVSGGADMTVRIWNPDASEYLLALYVEPAADVREAEWVMWTPLGYYASSPNGDRLVGWHFNRGLSAPPVFETADRMVGTLYRPDIVGRVLALGDVARGVAEAEEARVPTCEPQATLKAPVDLGTILPPEAEILYPRGGDVVDTPRIYAEFRIAPGLSGRPIADLRIEVNDRRAQVDPGPGPLREELRFGCELELRPGRNEIVLISSNGHTQSAKITVTCARTSEGITRRGLDVPQRKATFSAHSPVITVLSIGSGQYGEHKLDPLPYGVSDAERVAEAFRASGAEVRAKVVRDPARDEVIQGLEWFKKEVVEGGLGVLYVSGHGVVDAGNYRYVPGRFGGDLALDAVPWTEFLMRVDDVGRRARVVFLLDTCHAGGAGGTAGGFQFGNPTIAAKQLEGLDVGIVILAAAGYSESAAESRQWGGGAFTTALVKRLGVPRKEPLRIDRLILDVKGDVRTMTRGAQRVEAIFDSNRQPEFVVLE